MPKIARKELRNLVLSAPNDTRQEELRDLLPAIEDRIAEIERTMRTDRKRYNNDEDMQTELRLLYAARERAQTLRLDDDPDAEAEAHNRVNPRGPKDDRVVSGRRTQREYRIGVTRGRDDREYRVGAAGEPLSRGLVLTRTAAPARRRRRRSTAT